MSIRAYAGATVLALLAGCISKGPAELCLESFKKDLKDPESGKVILFEGNMLTYTATNSYGARTQSKALCKSHEDKWYRDERGELLLVLAKTEEILGTFNQCRSNGGTSESCAGGFVSLKYIRSDGIDSDQLIKEVRSSMGF